MLKKTITYEDLNGDMVSEDHFFHLSKADLVELEMSKKGGLSEWLQNIVESEDGKAIITEFKKLLIRSHGEKSDDGKRFVRDWETGVASFEHTEAYSALFMELVTDAKAAAEFVNGVVPKGITRDIPNLEKLSPHNEFNKPVPRVLTRQEMVEMDLEELKSILAAGAIIGN